MKEYVSRARVGKRTKQALAKAVKKGIALNESDYIRRALDKQLREDGLIEKVRRGRRG